MFNVLFIDKKRFAVISLMVIDFLITYVGIQSGHIHEANPLLVWLFELNFGVGLFIRLTYVGLIFQGLEYIRVKRYKWYNEIIVFALILNVAILVLHIHWILIVLVQ